MRRPRRLEEAFWSAHSRNWDDALVDDDVTGHINDLADWLAASVCGGAQVADLGAGTGNHAIELARRGCEVLGADVTSAMLHRAREKGTVAGHGASMSWLRLDLNVGLPVRTDALDGAISVYAAQFVELGPFLREVRRVLRPGGAFLLEAPSPNAERRDRSNLSWRYRAFQQLKAVSAALGTRAGLVRTYTSAELVGALAAAGFTVVEQRPTPRSTAVLARAG